MYRVIEYQDIYEKNIKDLAVDVCVKEFGFLECEEEFNNLQITYHKNGGNFWIALKGEEVIGTIGLCPSNSEECYLKTLYLKSEHRGQGISTQLISNLLDFAKNNGYKKIALSTYSKMQRAISFYKKHGFETNFELTNENVVHMYKHI